MINITDKLRPVRAENVRFNSDGTVSASVNIPYGYKVPKEIELSGIPIYDCEYRDGMLYGKSITYNNNPFKIVNNKIGSRL